MEYIATVNVPGYLPMDDEPPTFESAREAWQYLVSEVERSWDEYPADDNGACVDAHTAMHNLDQSLEGSVHAPTPGYEGDHDLGLVYSVTRVHGYTLSESDDKSLSDCRYWDVPVHERPGHKDCAMRVFETTDGIICEAHLNA